MAEPTRVSWWRSFGKRWLPLGLSLLFVLMIRVPWTPDLFMLNAVQGTVGGMRHLWGFGYGDASWILELHESAANHVDFSTRVFTFGPWGFLYHGYHPKTYGAQIVAWLFLAIVFWWASDSVIARGIKRPWVRAALICLVAIIAWRGFDHDAGLFAYFALLIAYYFFAEEEADDRCGIALVLAITLLSLVKFSLFLAAGPIVLLITADECLRRRRWPRYLPAFVVGVFAFWLLARQPIGSFSRFLRNSWEIAGKFDDAMSWAPPANANSHWWKELSPGFFLLVACPILALVTWISVRRRRMVGAGGVAALAFFLFVCMKAGFVRMELFHPFHAMLAAMFTAVLFALCLLKHVSTWRWKVAAATCIVLVVVILSRDFSRSANDPLAQVLAWVESVPASCRAIASCLSGNSPAQVKLDAELQEIRDRNPLPPVAGTVDIYHVNAIILFANRLDWQPRPVLQSYSAYSPMLSRLDADHLKSPDAAEWIFFDVYPIDGRFPALEDSLSWPELLTRYDVTDDTGGAVHGDSTGFLVLHKSAHPRTFSLTPISQTIATFRNPVFVPNAEGRAVWVEIDVTHSLAGSAMAAAFKTPSLWLNITRADRAQMTFRLPAGMAKAGFLLSPFIGDGHAFANFARRDWARVQAGELLTQFQIAAGDDAGSERYFNAQIPVRFSSLEFPRDAK